MRKLAKKKKAQYGPIRAQMAHLCDGDFGTTKVNRSVSCSQRSRQLSEPSATYIGTHKSDSFEGEAILSVGKIVEYYHQNIGGVVNVMPFTCMPSTVVSTQTMRVSADCENMPILNLSFDGQEDSTLTTRLEAFVEQVSQRHRGELTALELLGVRK